jgi:hypothetical protein
MAGFDQARGADRTPTESLSRLVSGPLRVAPRLGLFVEGELPSHR